MAIEKWSDIIPSVAKAPYTLYKNRHTIQKWWKRAQAHFKFGKTNIVILGRPNVGKSVMAAYLYGETNNLSWDLPTTSTEVEAKALTIENWTKLVRVIPGQKIPNRYSGIEEAFSKHEALEGIIYVADWGFTDERDPTVKERKIKGLAGTDKFDSVEKIRAANMKDEIEDFKLMCHEIERAFTKKNPPKWLLIIANKADLFFDKLDEAQAYYHPDGDSEFSRILQAMRSRIGEQNLKCAAIPMCAYERSFEWNGEIVKTQIGGEENRKQLARNFFKTIANF